MCILSSYPDVFLYMCTFFLIYTYVLIIPGLYFCCGYNCFCFGVDFGLHLMYVFIFLVKFG